MPKMPSDRQAIENSLQTPAAMGYAMPAEWDDHDATWIAWPHNEEDWPGKFAPIPWIYAEIVRLLARGERVNIFLQPSKNNRVVEEVRAMDVCHVALFGIIQMSTQAVQRLCDEEIPVTWFSMGGWFYGMTRGHSLKNVLLRIEQFRQAADPASCLRLAQQFVRGKIHNHRVLFMRNHIEPPERTKLRLGQARGEGDRVRGQGYRRPQDH
jgi:hypothetical protein